MSDISLAKRISVLEAREAIKELIANYSHGVDKQDEPLFLSLWEEDAIWDLGEHFGFCNNKSEIKEKNRENWGSVPETHHHVTNIVIQVDIDSGIAEAISDVDGTGTGANGVPLVFTGTYRDQFTNKSGKWRFARRALELHYMTPAQEPWSNHPEGRFKSELTTK